MTNDILNTKDIYFENHFRKELIKTQIEIKKFKVPESSNSQLIVFEFQTLKNKLNDKKEVKFNGMIEIIEPLKSFE